MLNTQSVMTLHPLVSRACPDSNTKLTIRDHPHSIIPVGEIIAGEINLHNLGSSFLKVDAPEATQHLWWFDGASREVELKLRNLASTSEFNNQGESDPFVLPLPRLARWCFVVRR